MRKLLLLGAIFLGLAGSAQARGIVKAGNALLHARSLVRPTLTLVAPDGPSYAPTPGAPVGGQLQVWVDRSHAPTIPGTLIVSVNQPGYECGEAWDCSAAPVMHGTLPSYVPSAADDPLPAETWVYTGPGQTEWGFDWELGHQFDWGLLTDAQRHEFAVLFRNTTTPWWDSLQGLAQGQEDGLEEEFAADYANCATDELAGVVNIPNAPLSARFMTRFCKLLDQVGGEDGAVMPRVRFSFAWWWSY